MAKQLRIVKSRSRAFQCDVCGCRNRTTNLISKRADVTARPLHLCDDCIDGLYALTHDDNARIDSPAAPLPADPGDTLSGGGTSYPTDGAGHDKSESKPNRARKKGAGA